jgi:hypothetical protein
MLQVMLQNYCPRIHLLTCNRSIKASSVSVLWTTVPCKLCAQQLMLYSRTHLLGFAVGLTALVWKHIVILWDAPRLLNFWELHRQGTAVSSEFQQIQTIRARKFTKDSSRWLVKPAVVASPFVAGARDNFCLLPLLVYLLRRYIFKFSHTNEKEFRSFSNEEK